MFDTIIDNSISLNSLGFYTVGKPTIPPSNQDVNLIKARGRNGSIKESYEYNTRTIPLPLNFEGDNINKKLRELKSAIRNARTIQFNDDLGIFYKILNLEFRDAITTLETKCDVEISILSEPFDYFIKGTDTIKIITPNTKINNIGNYYSEPYFKIYAQGNIILTVNDEEITLNNVDEYIELDSEEQECFKNDTRKNRQMIGEFPIFKVGENSVSWSGSVTKIEIIPRWRCL